MLTCRCLVSYFLPLAALDCASPSHGRVTKESAFLKPAGFRKHKAPWPGRAEVSCTILTHQYFMLSLASYPCFHTRAVTVKVEHFWRSRRKKQNKPTNRVEVCFYHFIKAAGCSGVLPKLSRSSPVNHRRVFRRRSRASPGQPHTNTRAGERRVVRRCTAVLIRLNLLQAWLSLNVSSVYCPFIQPLPQDHHSLRHEEKLDSNRSTFAYIIYLFFEL